MQARHMRWYVHYGIPHFLRSCCWKWYAPCRPDGYAGIPQSMLHLTVPIVNLHSSTDKTASLSWHHLHFQLTFNGTGWFVLHIKWQLVFRNACLCYIWKEKENSGDRGQGVHHFHSKQRMAALAYPSTIGLFNICRRSALPTGAFCLFQLIFLVGDIFGRRLATFSKCRSDSSEVCSHSWSVSLRTAGPITFVIRLCLWWL